MPHTNDPSHDPPVAMGYCRQHGRLYVQALKQWVDFDSQLETTMYTRKQRCDKCPPAALPAHIVKWVEERGHTLRYVEAFGKRQTLTEWTKDPRCVVCYKTLHRRLYEQHMRPELALTLPPKHAAA